jgi:FADH2 O2-dependent halogenase
MDERFDVVIIGSGFSGSLLSWILAKQGRKVLLVDSGHHPRFAIGESSTPTADFLIHHIASRWGLEKLAPLATWGSWTQAYPELVCGKKRGFSYYKHEKGRCYVDDHQHSRSFLVAASCDDRYSDTHWLRSSVDQFFVQCAVDDGAILLEGTSLQAARYDRFDSSWKLRIKNGDGQKDIASRWLIDASGGGAATADFVNNPLDDDWMRTRTRATFAHYQGVEPFSDGHSADDPFCGDDAAQHHLVENGWWWMLRFDNGITSVGLVEKLDSVSVADSRDVEGDLRASLGQYPSVAKLLRSSRKVAPVVAVKGTSQQFACAIRSGRLSRCRAKASAPGLILLPNAYGFVDPLHSTGIAHALSGVTRAAEILLEPRQAMEIELNEYDRDLRREMRWLDTLIAGCYFAMPNFQRFVAYSSFYFAAAIRFEAIMSEGPSDWPEGFLQASDRMMMGAAETTLREINDPSITDDQFTGRVRQRISCWNNVGLLEPQNRNRLDHTAAPKW